ncbi:MAG: radical SAM protein [Acidobacteriota bacterium]
MLHAVSWNLTQRCNLRCRHCYLDSSARGAAHPRELTRTESLEVIHQLSEMNPRLFLILTGGEPLLHPDLHEIIGRAASRGMTVVLGTNGTLITRRAARELKDAGLGGAGVSIDSIEPSAHDGLRGVTGAWQRTMSGIAAMKEAGLGFLIQTSVFSWNRHELPRLAALAQGLGASALNLYFLVCTGRGQELTDLSPASYEATLEAIYRLQERMGGELPIGVKCAPHYKRIVHQHDPDSPFLASYQGGCPAATHYCRIDPTGEVTPCPYMPPTGDTLRRRPFREIWETSPRFVELRARSRLGGRCGLCEYRDLCGGCRARALAVLRDPMDEDPSCTHKPGEVAVAARVAEDRVFGLTVKYSMPWTPEARDRLRAVPSFLHGMVVRRVEAAARKSAQETVTPQLMEQVRQRTLARGAPFPPAARPVLERAPEGPREESGDDRTSRQARDTTVAWTGEARARVEHAPSFVRPGILKLMQIRARQRGHSAITSAFLTEIRNESMMRVARVIRRFGFEELKEEAFSEAKKRMRKNLKKVDVIRQIGKFLADRTEKNQEILDKFQRYLRVAQGDGLPWTPEALAWLRGHKPPREELRRRIEERARQVKAPTVSVELIREFEM